MALGNQEARTNANPLGTLRGPAKNAQMTSRGALRSAAERHDGEMRNNALDPDACKRGRYTERRLGGQELENRGTVESKSYSCGREWTTSLDNMILQETARLALPGP